jgi:hypothetical protein
MGNNMFGNGGGGGGGGQTTIAIVVALCCCSSLAVGLFLWYAYRNRENFTWLDWFFDIFDKEDATLAPEWTLGPGDGGGGGGDTQAPGDGSGGGGDTQAPGDTKAPVVPAPAPAPAPAPGGGGDGKGKGKGKKKCPESKDKKCKKDPKNCKGERVRDLCAQSCKDKCRHAGSVAYRSKPSGACYKWKKDATCDKERFAPLPANDWS